jgi:hypothetical protein
MTFKCYMYETQRRLLHAMHYQIQIVVHLFDGFLVCLTDILRTFIILILLRKMGAPSCLYLQDQFSHCYSRRPLHACSSLGPHCVPNLGEALAALLAAQLAASLNLKLFILKGDSSTVIVALNNPHIIVNWSISPTVSETLLSLLP